MLNKPEAAMRCITITYQYSGDEARWRAAIDDFLAAIAADPVTAEGFSYQVAVADDGVSRIHWGHWDSQDTLKHLQSQAFFKTFSGHVKTFAGDSLTATGANVVTRTESGW
jgi:hypothetical protein